MTRSLPHSCDPDAAGATRPAKSELTRQKILDTGRQLVIREGFGAMGLSALLREAGVPKGSFYHYFASKEAFGEALLQDYVADYLARLEALMQREPDGAARLLAFCAAWLGAESRAGLVQTCLVVKLGAEVADLSEPMRQVLAGGVEALTDRLAAILRQGGADGSLRAQADPGAAARVLYAQWLGAAILAKLSQDQAPLERALADTRARLVIHQGARHA